MIYEFQYTRHLVSTRLLWNFTRQPKGVYLPECVPIATTAPLGWKSAQCPGSWMERHKHVIHLPSSLQSNTSPRTKATL